MAGGAGVRSVGRRRLVRQPPRQGERGSTSSLRWSVAFRRAALRFARSVVGEGPERAALQAKLPDATFTGHLGGAELATAYASSDVFLFPSETETFGNVTLEAMASGLPVVCADAAGSQSLVEDGATGLLCPPRDVDAFEQAARRLVDHPALRAKMGGAGRDRARAYDWPTVLETMESYYYGVTGTSASQAVRGA